MLKLWIEGVDGWGRPVYKDDVGRRLKDVNLGRGELSLYSAVNNDFEGEPNTPFSKPFKVVYGFKYYNAVIEAMERQDRAGRGICLWCGEPLRSGNYDYTSDAYNPREICKGYCRGVRFFDGLEE